jgi:hypothetical protein
MNNSEKIDRSEDSDKMKNSSEIHEKKSAILEGKMRVNRMK